MVPNKLFLKQPKDFWSQVKILTQRLGYSKKESILTYTIEEIVACLEKYSLKTDHLYTGNKLTDDGQFLLDYFIYRAKVLESEAKLNLMDKEQAKQVFDKLYKLHKPKVKIPMNKQKGKKKHPAYFTGIVNILTETTLGNVDFNLDPRTFVIMTRNQKPLYTLSRMVDGAYPSVINPLMVWEIKEYYNTTTFGSRVAGGVYETILDGYELTEIKDIGNFDVKHYLIIDGYLTWWMMGKSYLCRMVDMLHEGFLDEILFGKQVLTRWPEIIKGLPKIPTKSTVVGRERLLQS